MLMFQCGLLASFIPEFFMVLGFLFCLFTANRNLPDEALKPALSREHVYTFENAVVSHTAFNSISYFRVLAGFIEQTVNHHYAIVNKSVKIFRYVFSSPEHHFPSVFSRPPPGFRF